MKPALLFPGQGSQSVGMLETLASHHSLIEQTLQEAGEVLDMDLASLVWNGPAELLNRTENTQPVILAASVALWRVLDVRENQQVAGLAGHSLGEYSALVCAGAIDFADGLRVVQARGRYMQEAVPEDEGAMAAIIGLDDQAVRDVCEKTAARQGVVEPVNYNAPGQVVIAGKTAAVASAMQDCKAAGAKLARKLAVSVPSHCSLMRPAAERLQSELENTTIRRPRFPVLHNVDAAARTDPDDIRQALVGQLYNPVQWVDTVRKLNADGVDVFMECGPGKVLCGLNRRIERGARCLPLQDETGLAEAQAALGGG